MTAADTTLDYQSLILPNWKTALKRKLKKIKPPSFWEIYWLCFTISNGVNAILDIVSTNYKFGAFHCVACGIEYKLYLIVKESQGNIACSNYIMWFSILLCFFVSSLVWL